MVAAARVELHDRSTQALIDVLENASKISYTLEVNKTATGSFRLPRDDPKWAGVIAFREVWMYDELGILIDVFRIMPFTETRTEAGIDAEVTLEGYGTVLQDDIVPAELIYTNIAASVILGLLLGYQTVSRVTLGTVDAALDKNITLRVSYDNLMLACWAVRNIVGGYITVEPTAGNPALRTLNLRANPGQAIGQRVSKGVNLREIGKTSDPSQAVTKIWPLGRGEGIAQIRPSTNKLLAQPATFTAGGAGRSTLVITQIYSRYKNWAGAGGVLPFGNDANDVRLRQIKVYFGATDDSANWETGADERTLRSKVNGYAPPAGTPTLDYVHADYLIADDTVGTYGTVQRPYTEKRHETSDALISAAIQVLDVAKQPRVSYAVQVTDLSRVYPTESFERLHLFDTIAVWDPDLNISALARIVAAAYGDLWDPSTYSITVAAVDAAPTQVQLVDRIRKYENMPDGATNIWVDSFEDNLDAGHPYVRDIYIPSDATAILKLTLNAKSKAYLQYISGGTTGAGGTGNNNVAGDPHNHPIGVGNMTLNFTTGIVTATTATTLQVMVDGNVASATAINFTDLDLTPYLTKDANGNIVRGWHSITFTPDRASRIQAAVVEMVFLQSRGVVAG